MTICLMSKIRNLFNKFKKKKPDENLDEDATGEIPSELIEEAQQMSEADESGEEYIDDDDAIVDEDYVEDEEYYDEAEEKPSLLARVKGIFKKKAKHDDEEYHLDESEEDIPEHDSPPQEMQVPQEMSVPREEEAEASLPPMTEDSTGEIPVETAEEEIPALDELPPEVSEEPSEEMSLEATEETTGDIPVEPTEELTGEITAEATENLTGELTVEASEDVTGEIPQEMVREASDDDDETIEDDVEAALEEDEDDYEQEYEEEPVGLIARVKAKLQSLRSPKQLTKSDLPKAALLKSIVGKLKQKLQQGKDGGGLKPLPKTAFAGKINLNDLHNEFFKENFLNHFHRYFVLLLVVLSTYHFGKLVGLMLTGPVDLKADKQSASIEIDDSKIITIAEVKALADGNLFKTKLTKEVKEDTQKKVVVDKNVVCKKATRPTRLPIKLVNTVVLQDSVKSIASVQIRSSELTEVREKESIDGMARVDKIDRLNLVIKNLKDGSCESVFNDFEEKQVSTKSINVLSAKASKKFKETQKKQIAGVSNDGNKFKIKKAFIKDKMKDLSQLLTQARGIPIRNPDGTLSFKIVEVEPGGIFSYLGIKNDDIVTHINGEPIQNLNEVMSLFSRISNLDKLNLTISRGGETRPLEYVME
jgi:type II secretory pathway component PulC